MLVPKVKLAEDGPEFSRLVLGFWRLADWKKSQAELLDMVGAAVELGMTTFDHADIYGDYTCEQLFGPVLAQQPGLRSRIQLITKCGIKLISENRPAHQIKHYARVRRISSRRLRIH